MPLATDIRTVGSIIAGVATAGIVSVAVLAGGQPAELATVRAASAQPAVVELVPASTSDAVTTALVVTPPTRTGCASPPGSTGARRRCACSGTGPGDGSPRHRCAGAGAGASSHLRHP
jgi:hypothetical protein